MNIQVQTPESDYNEHATGRFEMTVEEYLQQEGISTDDIVKIQGNHIVINSMWGNDEGYDVVEIEIIDGAYKPPSKQIKITVAFDLYRVIADYALARIDKGGEQGAQQ